MATSAELLAQVDEAISAVLLGQSYTINGRSLTRANLAELRAFRQELQAEVERATNSMIVRSDVTGLRT